MKEIQSVKNQIIKEVKKFHQKKQRDVHKKYLLEGYHLVEEAVLAGATIDKVFIDQKRYELYNDWLSEQLVDCYLVSTEVLKALSELPTPQGIVALVDKQEQIVENFTGAWLLLDGVQDPGNVGTLIRTADAAGFSGVILGEGTADLYSSKVLRSLQGSHFHLPIIHRNLIEVIQQFKQAEIPVYGTELNQDALPYTKVTPRKDIALVLGNEGQGVSQDVLNLTDRNLYIPIYGQAESLNVGIAGGILMYHFVSDWNH